MDNKLQELLTITMEECGELIQACSKAIRCDQYYDNDNLLEEIGDVQCMIELIHDYDLVSWEDVNVRMKVKKEKLKQWTTSIFYINTNNGHTRFENGKRVESVANRMVTFPSHLQHTGTSCTNARTRVLINFNYYTLFEN